MGLNAEMYFVGIRGLEKDYTTESLEPVMKISITYSLRKTNCDVCGGDVKMG